MRIVITLIIALLMAACATFLPIDKRTIELPTEKYRQPALTATEAVLKIKESCDRFGRFHVDGERYTCERI